MNLPSDVELFTEDNIPELQKKFRHVSNSEEERRRAKLFLDLSSLTKRFINERLALEARLSERGMAEFSASIYALQWDTLYYAEQKRQQRRRELGYWRRLWNALLNK